MTQMNGNNTCEEIKLPEMRLALETLDIELNRYRNLISRLESANERLSPTYEDEVCGDKVVEPDNNGFIKQLRNGLSSLTQLNYRFEKELTRLQEFI